MNCTNSSKIFSMLSSSSALEWIRFYLLVNLYSSFLYFLIKGKPSNFYFSNSMMISSFFSSSFLYSSLKPSWMLFSCYSINLSNSSFTYSMSFEFSSMSLFVLSIIFLRSMTFYFSELALKINNVDFTHFFYLHEGVTVVIIVDAFNTNWWTTGFAEVFDEFMRMFRAWNTIKVAKE